jgi:hypothetical protein
VNKKENGLAALNLVIIVAIVGIIGFVAWRVIDSHKQAPAANVSTSTSQSTTPPDQNNGYQIIKEWGVRFKPAEGLTDLEYKIGPMKETGEIIAAFSTKALSKYGTSCSAALNGHYPLGIIKRFGSPNDQTNANPTTKHIGSFYYTYVSSQAACVDAPNADAEALQTKTLGLFKSSIATLEAAK